MEKESVPEPIDQVQRRLQQLELADRQLADEPDASAIARRDLIREEMNDLRAQLANLREQWEAEKMGLDDVQTVRRELEQIEHQFRTQETEMRQKQASGQPVDEREYQNLFELDQKRQGLNQRLEAIEDQAKVEEPAEDEEAMHGATRRLLRKEVTDEEIAEVVSAWTGVPVSRMMEAERAKLLVMEERLHQRVVGQDQAVTAIADAVRRSRSGLQDPNRPIGSFLFLGPTGVGKTEVCKALAQIMFDDESAMVRIDMSEFMERHSVARLIGAPPGYVGYEEGGKLTELVRRRPYAVILLDEMEKAHPDVFNVLLQVLDDGRLTDGQGRTVDFTNTVIVMTSNVGSQAIQRVTSEGGTQAELVEAVEEMLRAKFLPEFLNRIDETVVFQPLQMEQIVQIVRIQLQHLAERLEATGLKLEVTDQAVQQIATEGYQPAYGARPLKRVIQREIQNRLATELLRESYEEGTTIVVDYQDDGYVFQAKAEEVPA